MSDIGIGKLIEQGRERDSIHVAVAPVVAGEKLAPGDHVGFIGEGIVGECEKPIGIVDPFLKGIVRKDQRFYLFLYPGSISSLRHDWTHPAFPGVSHHEGAAKDWLTSYARRVGLTYDELIAAAEKWVRDAEYTSNGGQFEGEYVPDEFWIYYEAATGRIVPQESRENFFSCSC